MQPLKIGIGGPVGSGKTAPIEKLCCSMRNHYELAAITNDIYTREDAEILLRAEALTADRILELRLVVVLIQLFEKISQPT